MLSQGQAPIAFSKGSGNKAIITTNDYKGAAILESGFYQYQIVDSSQNSKLPFARFFETQTRTFANFCEKELLYFSIGNSIDVEFTSTTIIFPFHCFT